MCKITSRYKVKDLQDIFTVCHKRLLIQLETELLDIQFSNFQMFILLETTFYKKLLI